MDIDALRDEGAQLAKLLGAVEKAGGWSACAAKFPQRPRVRRAAPWLGAASDRAALAVAFANAVRAKEVVKVVEVKTTAAQQRKRANALSKRIAAAEHAAATAARASVRADDPPLEVALLNAGLTSSAPGEHNLVDPVFPRALRWLNGDDGGRRARTGAGRSLAGRRAVVGRPAEAVAVLRGAARGARDRGRGSDENCGGGGARARGGQKGGHAARGPARGARVPRAGARASCASRGSSTTRRARRRRLRPSTPGFLGCWRGSCGGLLLLLLLFKFVARVCFETCRVLPSPRADSGFRVGCNSRSSRGY